MLLLLYVLEKAHCIIMLILVILKRLEYHVFIILINNLINKIWEFREFRAYNEVEFGGLRQTPRTPVVTRCDKLESARVLWTPPDSVGECKVLTKLVILFSVSNKHKQNLLHQQGLHQRALNLHSAGTITTVPN